MRPAAALAALAVEIARQEGHRRLDLHIPADLWEKFAFVLEDGTGQPAQALVRWMSAYARRYLS